MAATNKGVRVPGKERGPQCADFSRSYLLSRAQCECTIFILVYLDSNGPVAELLLSYKLGR